MKKIMFNEHFGLQQSVLDGTKTMTRRIVPEGILLTGDCSTNAKLNVYFSANVTTFAQNVMS